MQLTNIARDVGEDARAGRVYLPRTWLAADGLDVEAWLADPRPHPVVAGSVERLLAEAATLYRRAVPGIARLPGRCRPAIHAARLLYAEIGAEVARHGHDSVTRRAVGAERRAKLALVGRALAAAPARGAAGSAPPAAVRDTVPGRRGRRRRRTAGGDPPPPPELRTSRRRGWSTCSLRLEATRQDGSGRGPGA